MAAIEEQGKLLLVINSEQEALVSRCSAHSKALRRVVYSLIYLF